MTNTKRAAMYRLLFDRCRAVARARGEEGHQGEIAQVAGVQASVISSCLSDSPRNFRELHATALVALADHYGAEAVWGTLQECQRGVRVEATPELRLVAESVGLSRSLSTVADLCVHAVEDGRMDPAEAAVVLPIVRGARVGLSRLEAALSARVAAGAA